MKRKGFTLIELLIVIAIIGVLSAALYPTIRDALARGRDGARAGNLNNISTVLETFNADFGAYPDSAVGGECITDTSVFIHPDGTTGALHEEYFKGGKPAKDPTSSRSFGTLTGGVFTCAEDGQYFYENFNGVDGVEYIIGTVMESEQNNNMTGAFDTSSYALADGGEYFVKVF
ncbi:type II secretion system protein [Patescibacteria group bacterium]